MPAFPWVFVRLLGLGRESEGSLGAAPDRETPEAEADPGAPEASGSGENLGAGGASEEGRGLWRPTSPHVLPC